MPIGKRQGNIKKASVIPRSVTDVTGRGNPFLFRVGSMFQCGVKGNGFPRRSAPRDGGIPRFIDLPPSPFRGNDTLFFTLLFLFRSARVATLATPSALTRHFP